MPHRRAIVVRVVGGIRQPHILRVTRKRRDAENALDTPTTWEAMMSVNIPDLLSQPDQRAAVLAELCRTMTRDELYSVLLKVLTHKFEMSGNWFDRQHVEAHLGRPLTDEEWEEFATSYWWEQGLPNDISRLVWEGVDEMLIDLDID